MGGAVGNPPAAVFVWRHPNSHRTQKREGVEGSYRLVSHCHAADGHRLHPSYFLIDGVGLCDYPSYSSTHHGCLWRFVGKPTGSRG